MLMVMELVLTALAAVLLSFLVAKLVSAVVGGGEGTERVFMEERRLEVGGDGGDGRRSRKRVRFAGVEERLVVDWSEYEEDDRIVFDEGSDIVAADEGLENLETVGNLVEQVGGEEGIWGEEDCGQFGEKSAEVGEGERTGEVSGLKEVLPEESPRLDCEACAVKIDVLLVDESGVHFAENNAVSGNFVDEVRGEMVQGAEESERKKKEEIVGLGFDEAEEKPAADVAGSCRTLESLKREEIGAMDAKDLGHRSVVVDDTGVGSVVQNIVCNHPNEVVSGAQVEHIDDLFDKNENIELQAMDVENVDCDVEEMNEELNDALAERIEEFIRNVNGGVIAEEIMMNEGYKNELEVRVDLKGVQAELKDDGTKERFECSGEDDWEGIEMSKLDYDFTAAAAFIRKEDKDGNLTNVCNEIKMQLHGLQKIVMEGPCCEPQPMALKMSARAKWNAWQRLGNMNPEDAMKQYIALVSVINPEWGKQNDRVDYQSHYIEATKLSASDPDELDPPDASQKKKEVIYNGKGIDAGSSTLI